MEYYRYVPKHPLIREAVDYFYWVKHPPMEQKKDQFLLPEGCFDLIFTLESKYLFHHETYTQNTPKVFFFGMNQKKVSISNYKTVDSMAIKFKPGGLAAFIREKQSNLSGLLVDAQNFFSITELELLNEQLLSNISVEIKMEILEKFLIKKLIYDLDSRVNYCLEKMEILGSQFLLSDLADEINISERHFRQLFQEKVGVSPKAYIKINRFQKVYQLLKSNKEKTMLTQMAYDLGYADQSHFIKECRAFALNSPKKFLQELHTSVFYNF